MRALALLRFGDRPSVQEISVPSMDDAALIRVIRILGAKYPAPSSS